MTQIFVPSESSHNVVFNLNLKVKSYSSEKPHFLVKISDKHSKLS